MPQPALPDVRSLHARFRARFGQRATGIALALLIEGLILLLLLTLAPPLAQRKEVEMAVFSLDAESKDAERAADAESPAEAQPRPAEPAPAPPEPAPPRPQPQPTPQPLPPPIVPMTPEQMAQADLRTLPQQPAPAPSQSRRPMIGPPAPPGTGTQPDTPRVAGQGPNGEPLYAAAWYREPYDDELRGYLSTAQGPGWGLIACRTVPDYRVEDCVALDEYPHGSNIARAVVAAAWQFRVRPPRLGGKPQVGEWVRIRIDYQYRRP